MVKQNIVASISYLDFINKITTLANDFLYNSVDGYLNKQSKEAIISAQSVVKKFAFEADKIKKSFSFGDESDFILKKKKELFIKIKEHYNKELLNWADEIFEEFVDNLFFELSINKKQKDTIYNSLICAINWIADVKKIEKNEYRAIVKEYNKKFDEILSKPDLDYLPNIEVLESDCSIFLKFWDLIFDDEHKFLNTDFSLKSKDLNQKDIQFFKNIQNKLQTKSKTNLLDEICLLNSAINELQLRSDDKKYNFIKQAQDDFSYFLDRNNFLKEEDKIKLIKRRIALFKESGSKVKKYYKKLITSLSE